MATDYTPNYNLDLYASADKPNLRDQYNAAMGKVDTAIMGNANAISATNTAVANLTTRVSNDEKDITGLRDDIDQLETTVGGKAPTMHAVTANTYGQGDAANFGHVKLSDAINATSDATSGTSATPKAVKSAYDLASSASTAAQGAQTTANQAVRDAAAASTNAANAQNAASVAQTTATAANNAAKTALDYSLNFTIFGAATMTTPYPLAPESYLRYALTESKNILKLYGRFALTGIPNPGIGENQVIATASDIPFTPPSEEFTVDGLGSLFIHKDPSTYGLYPLTAKVRTDGKIDLIAPGLAGWVGDIVAVAIAVPIVMKSFGDTLQISPENLFTTQLNSASEKISAMMGV
nr:MAG TPA: hypothetical protein [Caudoviricetes sp.]